MILRKNFVRVFGILFLAALILRTSNADTVLAEPYSLTRISVDSSSTQSNGATETVEDISKNGEYVLFYSSASNLVSGDTNSKNDLFLKNISTGAVDRVSIADDESQANGHTSEGKLSKDGRYVVFSSSATNLVTGDTNSKIDVFLRDLVSGTTTLISKNISSGHPNNHSEGVDISEDGRFIVWQSYATDIVSSDTNGSIDVFITDTVKNTTSRISMNGSTQGDANSYGSSISCDGRYVAFASYATNLVSGDTNGYVDHFIYDQIGGILKNITMGANGSSGGGPKISCSGDFVSFYSYGSNLVAGDTNAKPDTFLYDKSNNTTSLVSLANDESLGNNDSYYGTVSDNGRYVTFTSLSTNLVTSDSSEAYRDVFLRDRLNNSTIKISLKPDGTYANAGSDNVPIISNDGKYIAFATNATNLVSSDTNGQPDILLADSGNTADICVE